VTPNTADIDAEWLVTWCDARDRAECSTVEAALLDACPVVFDPRQYARAAGLGLAGRLRSVLFETVIFDGPRFLLAQHCEDQRDAEVAFLFPVHDADERVVDVAAWIPETGKTAMLLGKIGTLGLWSIPAWRVSPMPLRETLLDWWLADGPGLFILDPARAAGDLDGVGLVAADRAAAVRIQKRLGSLAHSFNIFVAKRAA
jgi:hypothetical protein